jgi:TIR domain
VRDKIFISYRRADSGVIAQKLYDDLKLTYGEEHVYFDLIGGQIGFDFGQRIVNALNDSAVILIVIGRTWVNSFRQRTGDTDWVEFELAHALKLDSAYRVVPVLAETSMPSPRELPASIGHITRLQAISLSRKANEWGPGVRVLHQEITSRGLKPLPFYIKPVKRLVRLQHHEHHFLASPNQTGEALVQALRFWRYNILHLDEDEGTATFQWGSSDRIAGKTAQRLYELMHKEGTDAVIERDFTGSVLNLSVPSARNLVGGAAAGITLATGGAGIIFGGPLLAAAIKWERRVVKRFYKGVERRLDGLDPGPDPLLLFEKRH